MAALAAMAAGGWRCRLADPSSCRVAGSCRSGPELTGLTPVRRSPAGLPCRQPADRSPRKPMTTPRAPASPASVAPRRRSMFGLASSSSRRGASFGALGAVTGVVACVVVVGGLMWSAATGQAPASRHPTIFGGSLVLDDYRPLTVIDLATGAVTVQLEGVYAQVGASTYADVEAVPTSAGTMLVNRATGAFNMLGQDNYVLGPPTNGIPRPAGGRNVRGRALPTAPPPISSATPPPARSLWWTPRPWCAVLRRCRPAAATPPSPWALSASPTGPLTRPVGGRGRRRALAADRRPTEMRRGTGGTFGPNRTGPGGHRPVHFARRLLARRPRKLVRRRSAWPARAWSSSSGAPARP